MAGLVTKTLKDGTGATFTGYFYDDGTGTLSPVQMLANGTNAIGKVGLQVSGADVSTSNRVPIDGSAVTQPISAVSLPLPSQAATSNLQQSIISTLGTPSDTSATSGSISHTSLLKGIATLLGGSLTVTNAAGANLIGKVGLQVAGADVASGNRIPVDGSGVTQPVSLSSIPLAANAATSAYQLTISTALGNPTDAAATSGSASHTALLKGIAGLLNGSINVVNAAGTASIGKVGLQVLGNDISASNRLPIDGSGVTQPISAASLPLPAGAATSANQLANIFYNETTTALSAGAYFQGPARDVGVAAGTGFAAGYFNTFFYSDQAGTAYLEGSANGSTWFPISSASLTAATPLAMYTPVMTRYHRARLQNLSTAQTTLVINTSYQTS